MTLYVDLGDVGEDDRITTIGQAAERGQLAGFIVDDDEKANRYIAKLVQRFKVTVVDRMAGPANTILVRVRPSVTN